MFTIDFEEFTEISKNAIENFCKNINNSTSDVFILMARKSLCFMKVLYRNGMIRGDFYQKIIVADTSIEFPCEYLKNKKITIIDDIMISGTSIARMIRFLLDMGIAASSINVFVIAIDKKYNYMEFVDHSSGHYFFDRSNTYVFEDSKCIELSANIAHLISRVGDSYNTDFPEYKKFIINKESYDNLFTKEYWEIYDVTNSYHKKGNVKAYTFIPSNTALLDIAKLLSCDLRSIAFFKIRLIVKAISVDQYECLIVPLIIINELSYQDMLLIWNTMFNYPDGENAEELTWGSPALLRMLQFFIPKVMADYFIQQKELEQIVSFDQTCLTTSFGYDVNVRERIGVLLKNIGHNSKIKVIIHAAMDCENELPKSSDKGAFELTEQLLKPIANWYWSKEIPTRNEIVNYAKRNGTINIIDDFDVIEKIDVDHRLNAGFSVTEFKKAISDMKEYYHVGRVISIFLDRAIDNGYIVPVNYIDENNVARRVYRHGEDFPFIKADESKILLFLKSLILYLEEKGLTKETFTKVTFEKILVLFMQLSKKELFDDFKRYDYHDFLTVKYCIHGAVLVNVNKDIYKNGATDGLHPYAENNQYTPWLREKFERKGIIKTATVDSSKGLWEGYQVDLDRLDDEMDLSVIPQEMRINIKKYVSIIGKWYSYSRKFSSSYLDNVEESSLFKGKGFRKDITVLTSCTSLEQFAGSILAELHYCILDLQNTVFSQLVSVSDEDIVISLKEDFSLYFGHEMNSFDSYRKYDTMAWSAMFNGIEKTDAYIKDRVQTVLDKVKKVISADDPDGLYKTTWESIWTSSRIDTKENADLKAWVFEAVTYLYLVYICYAELHNLCVDDLSKAIDYEKFRVHFINNVKQSVRKAAVREDLIEFVESIFADSVYIRKQPEEKKKYICQKLLYHKKGMVIVSQNIEMYLAEKSDQYIERYPNYFFITFNKEDIQTVKAALAEHEDKEVIVISWYDGNTICIASKRKDILLEILEKISLMPQLLNIIVFLDMTNELKLRYNVRTCGRNLQREYDQTIFTYLNIDKSTYERIVFSSTHIKKEEVKRWLGNVVYLEEKDEQIRNQMVCRISSKKHFSKNDTNKGGVMIDKSIHVSGDYIKGKGNSKAGRDIYQQIKSPNATQVIGPDDNFDFTSASEIIEKIKSYDFMLDKEFGENANDLRSAMKDAEEGIQKKDSSKVKSALTLIRDLAVGATGSIIASGILAYVKLLIP